MERREPWSNLKILIHLFAMLLLKDSYRFEMLLNRSDHYYLRGRMLEAIFDFRYQIKTLDILKNEGRKKTGKQILPMDCTVFV